ncbi:hypothetical protein Dimus_010019, partial [Dionaea muscipula]
ATQAKAARRRSRAKQRRSKENQRCSGEAEQINGGYGAQQATIHTTRRAAKQSKATTKDDSHHTVHDELGFQPNHTTRHKTEQLIHTVNSVNLRFTPLTFKFGAFRCESGAYYCVRV